jgi:esterase/lipase
MNPIELAQMIILLRRLRTSSKGEKQIHYYQHCLPDGTLVDIYRNFKKELSLWILVHGMTIAGPRHPRLIRFAQALAREGITCVIPKLNGLSVCRWELSDLEQLATAIAFGSGEINHNVGLLGFCNGGSYSLIAASRGQTAKNIHRVITIGAYHNLYDLIDSYLVDLQNQQKSDIQWEEEIYRYMALMYGYGDRNLLPAVAWEEMQFILERYPVSTSIIKKKQFYDKYLQHLDFAAMLKESSNHGNFDSLSPAGKVPGISPPATIIHAKNDLIVSSSHAERIYAELQSSPNPGIHRLLVTSAFSHVTPARMQILEVKRLCSVFAPIKEKHNANKNKKRKGP